MKKSAIILFLLLLLSCALHAQLVWHRPDSLLVFPLTDSVSSTEEYTVFAVFRSLEPATITIPYDDDLLPMGFRPKDIKTYYYDEDLAQWKELERVTVDFFVPKFGGLKNYY